jgi:uncharacterized membrane protein
MASKLIRDLKLPHWNWDLIATVAFWILTILLLLACTSAARADNCRQFFVHKQAVAVAPVVAAYAAPIYYQAGRDIEAEALAEKVARLAVPKIVAQLATANIRQPQTAKKSVLSQHCAKCHSGPTPKSGITIDGETPMDCWQITASLRAIASDAMPKDHKIAAEVKGQAMQELLDLEQAADRPTRVQVPEPSPTGELK